MNSNIPKHWVETSLKEVVHNKKGKKPKKLEPVEFEKSSPYIDIEAFETGKIKQFGDIASSNICDKKDVLVVWDGARFGLTGSNQSGAIGSTLACLTPILIESTYLLRFIQRHYQTIQSNPKGTGIPHVNPEVFWSLEFPLAPLNEQKRIVEKLDAILPKVKNAKARLENIPKILKKFRQSVLADACSGKLTEEWREGRSLKIGMIEDTIKDYFVSSDIFPQEWNKLKLQSVADYLNGFQFKSSKYVNNKKNQVIRIGNVKKGKIILEEAPVFIDDIYANECSRFEVQLNDILLSLTGTKYKRDYGFACRIKNIPHKLFLNQRVAAIRVKKDKILPEYLELYLHTDLFRDVFFSNETGNANQGNVGTDALVYPIIGVPPIEEQHEIVRLVEKLFALANSLEEKYKIAIARVEKIEQSVLAKAFRGELVEPDPNDEPAEILLKRILDVRAKNLSPQRKTGKKKKGENGVSPLRKP